jgi:plastocyanin
MKNRGISIIGIIVFIGLIALIVWGLNYIITQDFVVVRTPTTTISNNNLPSPDPTQNASSTATSTVSQTTHVATSTPAKTPVVLPAISLANLTSSDLTVTFTDKGFSPASLTVKKGQTVTFVNNSSDKMWVAANPFPTSKDYPAFNEKSGVPSGSSWSFTFDKTGTWFYHNHYHPAQGAKIVVNAK